MSKFDKAFEEVWFKLRPLHRQFCSSRRCFNEHFTLRKNDIIGEMNTEVFPVPKKLLSKLIEACRKNGWRYAYEYPFISVYNWMKESENIEKCSIDWKKMDGYRTYSLLLVCLPYDLKTWKEKLVRHFNEETVEALFKAFNGQNGASETYSNGQIIIVNSDMVDSSKDCEEILEHELIHMVEDINGAKNTMSPSMKWILDSPNELKTYAVNLINSLLALYDHKQTMFTSDLDTPESGRRFLDDLLASAESSSTFEDFYSRYEEYASSKLAKSNLMFLWQLVQWRPNELSKIIEDIYKEFLVQEV